MDNTENFQYKEELLSKESLRHFMLVGDFCCGADNPLNTFLSDDAFDYAEEKQGHTYILMDNEYTCILAFYTIKGNAIHTFNIDTNEYMALPVVEIARIAVDFDFQGNGLGKILFYDYIIPNPDKPEKLFLFSTPCVILKKKGVFICYSLINTLIKFMASLPVMTA